MRFKLNQLKVFDYIYEIHNNELVGVTNERKFLKGFEPGLPVGVIVFESGNTKIGEAIIKHLPNRKKGKCLPLEDGEQKISWIRMNLPENEIIAEICRECGCSIKDATEYYNEFF